LLDGLFDVFLDIPHDAAQFDPGDLMTDPKPVNGLRADAKAGSELVFVEIL
jgi:hypothetical protein